MPQTNRTAKGVLGGLLGLIGLSAVAGILVTATVTPVLAVAGSAGTQAIGIFDNLPDDLKPGQPMEPSTIYATDADGNSVALATFYDQNRTTVTFDQVNPVMYDAILSSEDKGFYEHGGIDIAATAKALLENLAGSSGRGASTISQQYVKNVLIQQCEQEIASDDEEYDAKTYQCWLDAANADGTEGIERKLQELRYAVQLEKDYSKDEILLGYLNLSSFGGTVYGIEAAANRYFSTTAANLTLVQAATLAGIVQNPNAYRIDKTDGSYTNSDGVLENSAADGYKLAKDRRDYVLDMMLSGGKITQEEHDAAVATPVEPVISTPAQGCAAAGDNAYFCRYVQTIIEGDSAFGDTVQERKQLLQRGGLSIYTSLDLTLQASSVEALKSRVAASDGNSLGGAAVSVEASTGRVLTMAQNTTYSETGGDQSLTSIVYGSDHAHGGSGGFPVGSTYKLFTLLDWLEKGHSVNEVLNGVNRTFNMTACGATSTLDSTKIGNFGEGNGSVGTVMQFTARSLNSGFFAMAEKLDLCDINKVAERLGITTTYQPPDVDGVAQPLQYDASPTLSNEPYEILGSKNIAPLEMAVAYATVANNGTYCTPRAIDRVVDQDGNDMTLPESSCTANVISPEVAATAAYALEGVMKSGGTGVGGNPGDGTELIGKTGTHQTWQTMMVTASTKVSTAVWVGRSNGEVALGTRLQNARFSIMKDIVRTADSLYGGDDFPNPDSNLTRRVLTTLPNVVGKTVDSAKSTLKSAGFSVVVGDAVDGDQSTDTVAAQSPGAGQVAGGTTVTIYPSNGQGAAVSVPDVSGQSPDAAVSALNSAGFTNVSKTEACSADNAKASGTDPASGSSVSKSTAITVSCSAG